MKQILARFAAVRDQPYQRLERWKRDTGKKIVGCLPMYVPEELIHAAGMLPVIVLAGKEPISLADRHLQSNACELVRSAYDMGLKGRLDFLDGLVVPDICDQLRFVYGIWNLDHPYPLMHVLALPHRQDEAALEYQLRLLGRFKAALEELAGGEITPDALRHSIQVYNQGRAKLRKLYQLRRQKPGLLGAREVLDVVVAAMLMPKEEHNRWLDELLVEVEAAPTPPPAPGQVKLFLAGQPCDPPDADLLDIIEAEGAVVVDDDMYTGFRYFATEVAPDGDPLMALARHYLNLIPCATTHRRELFLRPGREGPEDYGQFIIRMAKESGADGVVIMLVLYCDPYGFECVPLDDKLTKVGIPHLLVETEPETGALGRLRTRLQAFIEMVREQKLA